MPALESPAETTAAQPLLARQFRAMVQLFLRRYLRSRHLWLVLLFAGLPLAIVFVRTVFFLIVSGFAFSDPLTIAYESVSLPSGSLSASSGRVVFQAMLLGAYMSFSMVFTAIIFGNSGLREESDDQTLHYLYLQPIPRWLIPLGKYAAFLLMAGPIFIGSLVLAQILLVLPYGGAGFSAVLLREGRIGNLLVECLVVLVGLGVYGAFFLGLSNIFRSALYSFVIYGLELSLNLMPETIKQFSLAYYLTNMLPERAALGSGMFALASSGPSAFKTIVVLTLVTAAGLGLTCWFATRKECLYSDT